MSAHRHAAIREHTAAITEAADMYRRENHCPCGEFIAFSPDDRYPRICDRCQRRDNFKRRSA